MSTDQSSQSTRLSGFPTFRPSFLSPVTCSQNVLYPALPQDALHSKKKHSKLCELKAWFLLILFPYAYCGAKYSVHIRIAAGWQDHLYGLLFVPRAGLFPKKLAWKADGWSCGHALQVRYCLPSKSLYSETYFYGLLSMPYENPCSQTAFCKPLLKEKRRAETRTNRIVWGGFLQEFNSNLNILSFFFSFVLNQWL